MAGRSKGATTGTLTGFWDSSALVALCCTQSQSAKARHASRVYGRPVVWWATRLEVVSALTRLVREGHITKKDKPAAFTRLDTLCKRWSEIQPSDEVRDRAERFLGVHRLRSADALQLAAAYIWCHGYPRDHAFISFDGLLLEAAEAEGFHAVAIS